MRKYLYGTTALVAATLVAGTVHAAEPLKMGVSGSMQEWFGVIKNKKATATQSGAAARDINTFGINADTEVDFKGSTKLDNGMVVTGVIEIDANDNGANIAVDEQWVSVGTAFGTAYAGVRQSTNLQLHNEAPDVGIGYGDVDIWLRHPSGSPANRQGNATAVPGMLSFGGATAISATKASSDQNNWDGTSFERLMNDVPSVGYVSPQIGGFTVAGTYSSAGGQVGAVDKYQSNYNAWDLSLAYSAELGGVKIGADVGAYRMNGIKTNTSGNNSQQAYEGGLKVATGGFTLGGAYMRVMEPTKTHGNATATAVAAVGGLPASTVPTTSFLSLDGASWNIGASYVNGPWGVSMLYYTESHEGNVYRHGKDKFETYLASVRYDLGPGIALKSSGFYGKYKSKETFSAAENVDRSQLENKGYGLVSGLDLTF